VHEPLDGLSGLPNGDAGGVLRLAAREQLRHTYGCRYIEDGGELAMLSKILGHSSTEMTERYAAADRKAVRRDADQVYARQEERAG